jgi:hypothetical protein
MVGRDSGAEAGWSGDESLGEPVTNDWEPVAAALAELGLSTDSGNAVSAADVVLAAQVRLRYWRRLLQVGGLHQPVVHSAPVAGRALEGAGSDQADTAADREKGDFTFVRERIRTIKSARDHLLRLACPRRDAEAVRHSHS